MEPLSMKNLRDLVSIARGAFDENDSLICAGGAPRDIITGRPVRDIDLFVRMPADDYAEYASDAFERCCHALSGLLGADRKIKFYSPSANPESGDDITDCADIKPLRGSKFEGYTIQVIALDRDPVDDVHNYDFALSQVFVTPNGHFCTGKHWHDLLSETISYVDIPRSGASMLRSAKRLLRLRAKYAGWQFLNVAKHDELLRALEGEQVGGVSIEEALA